VAASTLLYWAGMVWNDYFDLAQDRKERPLRPIPSGRVTPRMAALLGTGLMLAGLGCAALADRLGDGGWLALPLAVVLLLAAFAFYLALAVVPALQRPIPDRVQPAIKRAILGLVLLDALLASALVGTLGLLLALLLLPGLVLGRWVYST